ncbi:hypothetical protein RhiJN_07321 [Ceratobasidium sp. AG-Ba]|nr:hypothetical protein RhiJN_07321 [Ceratobasidium sp. AG-Ba]QRW06773.1 hypothetical protein RhiLY_05772 [Ceratobasidium sp. AG-Ba]
MSPWAPSGLRRWVVAAPAAVSTCRRDVNRMIRSQLTAIVSSSPRPPELPPLRSTPRSVSCVHPRLGLSFGLGRSIPHSLATAHCPTTLPRVPRRRVRSSNGVRSSLKSDTRKMGARAKLFPNDPCQPVTAWQAPESAARPSAPSLLCSPPRQRLDRQDTAASSHRLGSRTVAVGTMLCGLSQ